MKLTDFLPQSEQTAIVQSIKSAELLTSGEIRVHVEPKCPVDDPYARAVEVFDELKMYQTQGRNAVLIYLAYDCTNSPSSAIAASTTECRPGSGTPKEICWHNSCAPAMPAKAYAK